MIEKNRFFLQKEGVNRIMLSRDRIGLKISKMGVIRAEPPNHAQVWEYPHQEQKKPMYVHKGTNTIWDTFPYHMSIWHFEQLYHMLDGKTSDIDGNT